MGFGRWARVGILVALARGGAIEAQQPAFAGALPEETMRNSAAPCLEPPPLVKWEDYRGPFQKVVGIFARKLERKSVHPPHYKPGAVVCALEVKDKARMLVQDIFDPASFFSAGYSASLDQAANRVPTFGQGAIGYGKRFGYDFAGQSVWRLIKEFAYPTAFSEDPRYYRLAHGSAGKRLFHATMHTFVAYRDNGKRMFNFSEWLGTASAVALNSAYYPGSEPGFAPAMRQAGYSVLQDMGSDVLREFWPEIARKFRLPFRDMREQPEKGTQR